MSLTYEVRARGAIERVLSSQRKYADLRLRQSQMALVQFVRPYILGAFDKVGSEMAGFLGLDELFEGRHFAREIIVLISGRGPGPT